MKTVQPFSIDLEIRTYLKANKNTNWSGLVNEFLREHIGIEEGEEPGTPIKDKIAMTKARLIALEVEYEKEKEKK